MSQPLVSVILPVYNGERYLADTLDSIFAQDYHPFEVIVVDDGSGDGSAKIAKAYHKARYIYQDNQGVPVARNAGVAAAQGEFIAFIDQDDTWLPHKLSAQVAYMLNHANVGYVTSKQQYFLEPGVKRPFWLKPELLEAPQTGMTPSTLLVRLSVMRQVGPFNPQFPTSSDADWFFRAKDMAIPTAALPEVLVHKRVHNANHSNQIQSLHHELLRVVKNSMKKQRQKQIEDKK